MARADKGRDKSLGNGSDGALDLAISQIEKQYCLVRVYSLSVQTRTV